MLCGTQERPISRNPGPGGSSTKPPCCLSHGTQQTSTCQAQPRKNHKLNCGAEITELDFAGDKSDFQSSTEYQKLELVFSWPPPLGFVSAVTKWLFLSLGTLLCYTLQPFFMLVSLLERTTSAENRFRKSRLHNRLPQSTPKVSLCHSALPLTQVYFHFWLWWAEPTSIGTQGVTLLYLLWGHGISHLKISYYSSLDEPQVELTARIHQSDFC